MKNVTILGIMVTGAMLMSCASLKGEPARVAVIAHRGASEYAPENTLAAFELASRMKADWFELDCALSKDGEIMICHDLTVDRTTNGKGKVPALLAADLKKLDAGSWKGAQFAGERMPTLRESLELSRRVGTGIYIEIKDVNKPEKKTKEPAGDKPLEEQILKLAAGHDLTREPALAREAIQAIEKFGTPNLELARKTAALVHEMKMEKEVVIQSFSPVVCTVVRLENPDLRVELLIDPKPDQVKAWEDFLEFAKMLDIHGCNLGMKGLTPERVKAFHKDGRTVAVWTVDDPAEMRRFAEMGVDAIITNKPDLCGQVLREMGRR